MDQELLDRWKTKKPPFDDVVLCLTDLVTLSDLRDILRTVVDKLKGAFGDAVLVAVEDWHEHDGYVTSGTATTWSEVEQALANAESLYAARPGDTYVHRAIYPTIGHFLLRFRPLEKDEDDLYPGMWGTFDLAAPRSIVDAILEELPVQARPKLKVDIAKAYFDRNCAG